MSRTVRVMVVVWATALAVVIGLNDDRVETQSAQSATEAPTGFGGSNGFLAEFCANQDNLVNSPNSPKIPDDECNEDAAVDEFTGPETTADGLGPIFNAAGCGECHIVPVLGGTTQIMEKRAGFFDGNNFFEHPGGSLIQDRSTVLGFQELVLPPTNVTTFRATLSVLGDGFVEAISNTTLQNIASDQPSAQRGQLNQCPGAREAGTTRVGRFGWKAQQASLLSFSADAYKNEMGITSPLEPVENTSNGVSVEQFDLEGVDDEGVDVELLRALHAGYQRAAPQSAARRQPGCPRRQRYLQQHRLRRVPHAHDHDSSTRHLDQRRRTQGGRMLSATRSSTPSVTSSCTTSARVMASCRTADSQRATRCERLRCGASIRAVGSMHDATSFSLSDAIDRHRGQASSARSAFLGLSSSSRTN